MDEVTLADILLILATSIVIFVILSLVNRGKNKTSTASEKSPITPAEENHGNTAEED